MVHKAADRVQETTLTVGTGPYTLAGAAVGFQTWLAGLGNGNSAYYAITNDSAWEVGEGALSGGTTLARTVILASSTGGAAINWPAGEKKIFLDFPAGRSVFVLPSGQLNVPYISMSDAPPANPIMGQMWWESDTGNSFVWYDDGNSAQWVPANVGVGGGGGGGGTIPSGTMAQFDTALTDGNFVYQTKAAALSTLTTTGSVGIGTSTPGRTLSIKGAFSFDDANVNPRSVLWGDGTTYSLAVAGDGPNGVLSFHTAANGVPTAERMRITSTGFAGIGTTSPTAQLTVAAQGTIHATRYGASQPSITFMTAGGTEGAPTPPAIGQGCGAVVWRAYDGVSNYAQLGGIVSQTDAAPTPTSSPGFMTFATTSAGFTGSAERMRITSAGNVGIGTTTPASLLHVDGDYITTGRYGATGALVVQRASGTQAAPTAIAAAATVASLVGKGYDGAAYRDIASISISTDGAVAAGSSPGGISFNTTPAGSVGAVERMRINSAGVITAACARITATDLAVTSNTTIGALYVQNNIANASVTLIVNGTPDTTLANGSAVGNFYVNNGTGGVYMAKNATSWTAISDERIKTVIEPIASALDKLGAMRAVIGRYNTDDADKRRAFLIAQDVQAVYPVATHQRESGTEVEEELGFVPLGLDYSAMVPLLVAAVKELTQETIELRARLAAGGL